MDLGQSPIAAGGEGGDEQGAPLAIAWQSSQNSILQSLLSADEDYDPCLYSRRRLCDNTDTGSGNLAKFIANDRDTWKRLDRPWTSASAAAM